MKNLISFNLQSSEDIPSCNVMQVEKFTFQSIAFAFTCSLLFGPYNPFIWMPDGQASFIILLTIRYAIVVQNVVPFLKEVNAGSGWMDKLL